MSVLRSLAERCHPARWRDHRPERSAHRESRQAAAATLHRERELLDTLLEHLPDSVYFKDTEGRFVIVNRAQAAYLGCADPQDLIGKTDFDFYPAKLAEHFASEERRLLETGQALINHPECQSPDEETGRWTLTTKVPVRGSDGAIIGLAGVTRDITELKQAQDALVASERRFRALVQHSADVITLVSPDGRILYQSPAGQRIFGRDPAQRIGQSGFEFVHPDDRNDAKELLERTLGEPGRAHTAELRAYRADGSCRTVEITATNCLDDPAVRAIVINTRDVTERKIVEDALRASETHLRLALAAARMGTWDWDVRAGTIYWLPPATDGGAASISTHGYADFLANVHPDDRGRIDAELQQALIHGDSFSSEFRLILADGRVIWVHSLGRIERDAGGEVVRMRGVEMDITARKEAEAALKASERRFRALVQNSSDLITIYDAKGILLYASPSMATILGQHPEEWQGRSALCLVHPEDIRRVRRAFAQLLRAPENRVTIEFRARHADGTWRWLEAIGTNLLHDPSIAGIVANARDITAHKRYAETLTHQAFHDALTGLPNRAQFTNRLQQALRRNIDSHSGLAVFFIDLDRFKVINDSLGHEGGDKLLTLAASRLATHLRPGDVLARFGGDEFAILVEDVSAGAVGSIAERFLAALQAPFVLDGHDVVVDASIGVVVASSNAQDATQLLRAADVAMYEAKRAGRGRWALYDERTGERAAQRLALESELRHAIEQRHLEVHYQPVIELATGRIHGFEALARWRHPTRGLLSPASFMVIAEETGLVGPLGEWVLGEACRQAATWAEMCPADPPLVAVNVSPRQLRCPHFPHSLWRVLGETRLPPHRLELEVTEEALAGD